MSIRVMLVDDHEVFRFGLRAVLSAESDIDVVGAFGHGSEVLDALESTEIDVLVLDVMLLGMSGLDVARHVGRQYPDVKTLMISMRSDDACVLDALRLGACGYVLKEDAAETVVDAVRTVAAGNRYLSTSLTDRAIDAYVAFGSRDDGWRVEGLSDREAEVIRMVCSGQTSAAIGESLGISPRTAETHRSHAMRKLGLHSVAELLRYAADRGLLPPQ